MADVKVMDIKARKQIVNYADFANTSSTSVTVPLHIPGRTGYLIGLYATVTTAFAGVTRPEIEIGYTGYTNYLMPKQRIDSANTRLKAGNPHQFFCGGMAMPGSARSEPSMIATVSSSSGNLSALTAGELEIVTVYVV